MHPKTPTSINLVKWIIKPQLDGMSHHDLYEKATHDPIVKGYDYEEHLGVYLMAQNSYFPIRYGGGQGLMGEAIRCKESN